jgi:hypothetical protein
MDSTRAPNALVFPGKNRLLLIMRIAGTYRRRTVASFQMRTSHSRSAISCTEERILATPRLGAKSMADDEGIQTLLDGGKVKSCKRGKSEPLC